MNKPIDYVCSFCTRSKHTERNIRLVRHPCGKCICTDCLADITELMLPENESLDK